MRKELFYIIVSTLLCLYSCRERSPSVDIANSSWISAQSYNKQLGEFTPNLIFSFRGDSLLIHQLGTGKQLFNLPYICRENAVYLEGKTVPFFKIIEQSEDELSVSLEPEDTTRLRRIMQGTTEQRFIKQDMLGYSYILNKDSSTVYHFTADQIICFSPSRDLAFKRIPYIMDNTQGIASIAIENLMLGTLRRADDGSIEVKTPESINRLTRLNLSLDTLALTKGTWKRGSALSWRFEDRGIGQLKIKETIKEATWSVDNSGYLIFTQDTTGQNCYLINNFALEQQKIGMEFAEDRFGDLLSSK